MEGLALRAYTERLLASGKKVAKAHGEMTGAAGRLKESLLRAPAYFREAEKQFQAFAEAEPYEDVKKDYRVVADLWGARAKNAERRAKELGLAPGGEGFVKYVESTKLFLERFAETLDAYPLASEEGDARHKALLERLQNHVKRFEELRKQLRKLRDKAADESLSTSVQGRLRREREAGARAEVRLASLRRGRAAEPGEGREPTPDAPTSRPAPTPKDEGGDGPPTGHPVRFGTRTLSGYAAPARVVPVAVRTCR